MNFAQLCCGSVYSALCTVYYYKKIPIVCLTCAMSYIAIKVRGQTNYILFYSIRMYPSRPVDCTNATPQISFGFSFLRYIQSCVGIWDFLLTLSCLCRNRRFRLLCNSLTAHYSLPKGTLKKNEYVAWFIYFSFQFLPSICAEKLTQVVRYIRMSMIYNKTKLVSHWKKKIQSWDWLEPGFKFLKFAWSGGGQISKRST